VVQETGLGCWKRFHDVTPNNPDWATDDFVRWACVIARYKVLSWQRNRVRDRLVFRESVVAQLADTVPENLDRHDSNRQAMAHYDSQVSQKWGGLSVLELLPGAGLVTGSASSVGYGVSGSTFSAFA